jgi:UDP-N-acetylmuramoyl-tripeptide--D-alanyl-D-alanine ligase
MIKLDLNQLLSITSGNLLAPGNGREILGVSIDSRTIQPKNLFIALKGENKDGHDFILEAVKKGASAVLLEKPEGVLEKIFGVHLISVADTKKSIQDISQWYRKLFEVKVVAITGSNGKTTTKDMSAEVLSAKFKVLKSKKSYNNQIGVPLTILDLENDTDFLIAELGMNQPGEIAILSKIVSPQIGVITNIGPAHLESMKNLETIAQEKFSLIENMAMKGTAILNADDQFSFERIKTEKRKVLSFGIKNKADFQGSKIRISSDGKVSFSINDRIEIKLKLLGRHNVYNALAAFAIGKSVGLEDEKIKQKLQNFSPAEFRMELLEIKGIRIINDSYNANPASMQNALLTLKEMKTKGKKIAVLGDMLELGKESQIFHQKMGEEIFKLKINVLVCVGELVKSIAEGAKRKGLDSSKVFSFKTNEQASSFLLEFLKEGDLVLVKGSRKMKLEEVVLKLKNLYPVRN